MPKFNACWYLQEIPRSAEAGEEIQRMPQSLNSGGKRIAIYLPVLERWLKADSEMPAIRRA
jgi:hypothetical protein